ncbi:MAG: radical SAM protein [Dehalococcoidia bacterium]|nr:MAG: radical SAM protein [Dehalococcoidia bacterium]
MSENNILYTPAYIALYESGELKKRADALNARLSACDLCPRKCGVNRIDNVQGYCRSGPIVEISSYCDHHGEEPALSGTRGSGTIFFNHCNLKCVYCQNHQISQDFDPSSKHVDSQELAEIMLYLQNKPGCHNINLVSPTHYIPQIVNALNKAVPMGMKIPLVYNTNGYDSISTLNLLDGIIDIYLPDIKYSSDRWANKFSDAKDYVACSRAAIKEMYRQVGNLITDDSDIAVKGVIIRHLILPNDISGSIDSLKWIAHDLSKEATLSIMAQYYPCHKALNNRFLSRKISPAEYRQVVDTVNELDLENGWLQEMDSAEHYLPDFERQGHPFEKA